MPRGVLLCGCCSLSFFTNFLQRCGNESSVTLLYIAIHDGSAECEQRGSISEISEALRAVIHVVRVVIMWFLMIGSHFEKRLPACLTMELTNSRLLFVGDPPD